MTKVATKTSLGPIVTIAIEQFFPERQRIIEDELAYKILPISMRIFVKLIKPKPIRNWMINTTEKDFPGIWGTMICRKRYIDEKLKDSISQIKAIVNIGAGFDTRIYRLPSLSDFHAWEIDQIENIQLKQIRLKKVLGKLPSNIKLVMMDFDHDDIIMALQSNGYSLNQKTFFIMEGVTQYLTESGIKSTFDFLANAAYKSRLVYTYIRKNFLDGQKMYGCEKLFNKYVIKDKSWIFGLNPEKWPEFLNHYGWKVIEDIDFKELNNKYIIPFGRTLSSSPVERLIYAEKL
jgi:methyltransferase (TIGR00027 family)